MKLRRSSSYGVEEEEEQQLKKQGRRNKAARVENVAVEKWPVLKKVHE